MLFSERPEHDYRAQCCRDVRTRCIYTTHCVSYICILKTPLLRVTDFGSPTFSNEHEMTLHCTTSLEQVTIPLKCLWLSSCLIRNAARPVFTERHKIKISQSLEEKCPITLSQIWKDTYEWLQNCWNLRKRGELELTKGQELG